MIFEVNNTRHGYVVEAYMLDKDGTERWLPLRNFGERQGDALDFCRTDCPKYSLDLIRGMVNTYRPDVTYARIANLSPSVRPHLVRQGSVRETPEEMRERDAENLRALYRANGLETTKTP